MGYVVKITREPGKGAVTKADAFAEDKIIIETIRALDAIGKLK